MELFWTIVGSIAGVAAVALAVVPIARRPPRRLGRQNRSPSQQTDPTASKRVKVAVIHGRDSDAREAMFTFLQRLGLRPLEWTQAIAATGRATPTTYAAIEAQLQHVQAVIVLMTPDDEARLSSALTRGDDDEDNERRLKGQPRQNVIFEAGMALGRLPRRTILVSIGSIRLASNFHGLSLVRITGGMEPLTSLATRLDSAGCRVDRSGNDWLDPGIFARSLAQIRQRATDPVPNDRGIPIDVSAVSLGLVDVENREEDDLLLPPTRFYSRAQIELTISGISCYQTFVQHVNYLVDILGEGRKVRILMLHPESEDLQMINARERHPVDQDIRSVLEVIRRHSFHEHPAFEVRFMRNLPPFTAVMIDGDVDPSGSAPADANGEIRVQPSVRYGTQHRGLVLQLKSSPKGAYEFFANDLRLQWKDAENIASFPRDSGRN